jgi:hypothetical protein
MIRKIAAFVPVLALAGTSVFAAQAPATDTTATKTEKSTKKHAKKHSKKAKTATSTDATTAPAKK